MLRSAGAPCPGEVSALRRSIVAHRRSRQNPHPALPVVMIAFLLCAGVALAHSPSVHASAEQYLAATAKQDASSAHIRWWTLKTEHFNVHFHDGLADVAQEAAFLAEHAYAILKQEFGEAQNVIDLVITDQVDATNGFTLPVFDCITIYTANLRWSDVGNTKNPSWLEALLFHELVHEIELNQVRGGARLARLLFGKIVMPNSVKPIPFVEGLAVYEKYKALGESRVSDSRTRMMARQMALDDAFPTFEQISYFYKRDLWPPSQLLGYNFGALFMKYIEDAYGDRALADIADIYARGFPLGGSFNRSVRKALGVSIAELYDGFIEALRGEFLAEAESIAAEGLTPAIRLTSLGGVVESPSWSKGTGLAAYANYSSIRNGVRLIDPATGADREAFACIGYDGAFPGLSADGEWIVYSKPQFNAGPYLERDLYVRNLRSGKETRLTKGERAYYARFSPDGNQVYYARIDGHDGSSALCAVDMATGTTRAIRSFADWRGAIHSFEPSPDGQSIALSIWRPGGYQDIYLMSQDGSNIVQVTSDLAQDCDPTWTPDGRHVLFSSDPDGVYNIYAADVETGEICKVTNVLSGAFFPSVSPDGSLLLFVGYGKDGYDLLLTDLDIASARPAPRKHDPIPDLPPRQAWEYEITPYMPLAHMAPTFWVPNVTAEGVEALVLGVEPVGLRQYVAGVGLDLANGGPTCQLAYMDQQNARFPLSLTISGGPKGNSQSVAISFPMWGDPSWSGGLTIEYAHAGLTGTHYHLLAADGDLSHIVGRDLLRSTATLQAQAALTSSTFAGPWTPEISVTLANSVRLPMTRNNRFEVQAVAGWTGSESYADMLCIGGHDGKYPVRGVEHAYSSGTHIMLGSAEYAFTLAPVEASFGPTSIFIDDLQASVFIDAGSAGPCFTLENFVASVGMEVGASIVPGYTSGRGLISLGLAKPIVWRGTAPEPQSDFTIYVKLSGTPL